MAFCVDTLSPSADSIWLASGHSLGLRPVRWAVRRACRPRTSNGIDLLTWGHDVRCVYSERAASGGRAGELRVRVTLSGLNPHLRPRGARRLRRPTRSASLGGGVHVGRSRPLSEEPGRTGSNSAVAPVVASVVLTYRASRVVCLPLYNAVSRGGVRAIAYRPRPPLSRRAR